MTDEIKSLLNLFLEILDECYCWEDELEHNSKLCIQFSEDMQVRWH